MGRRGMGRAGAARMDAGAGPVTNAGSGTVAGVSAAAGSSRGAACAVLTAPSLSGAACASDDGADLAGRDGVWLGGEGGDSACRGRLAATVASASPVNASMDAGAGASCTVCVAWGVMSVGAAGVASDEPVLPPWSGSVGGPARADVGRASRGAAASCGTAGVSGGVAGVLGLIAASGMDAVGWGAAGSVTAGVTGGGMLPGDGRDMVSAGVIAA